MNAHYFIANTVYFQFGADSVDYCSVSTYRTGTRTMCASGLRRAMMLGLHKDEVHNRTKRERSAEPKKHRLVWANGRCMRSYGWPEVHKRIVNKQRTFLVQVTNRFHHSWHYNHLCTISETRREFSRTQERYTIHRKCYADLFVFINFTELTSPLRFTGLYIQDLYR